MLRPYTAPGRMPPVNFRKIRRNYWSIVKKVENGKMIDSAFLPRGDAADLEKKARNYFKDPTGILLHSPNGPKVQFQAKIEHFYIFDLNAKFSN